MKPLSPHESKANFREDKGTSISNVTQSQSLSKGDSVFASVKKLARDRTINRHPCKEEVSSNPTSTVRMRIQSCPTESGPDTSVLLQASTICWRSSKTATPMSSFLKWDFD